MPIRLALTVALAAAAALPTRAADAAQSGATVPSTAEPAPAMAAAAARTIDAPAQPELADLLWKARPLVVFADSPQDPRYAQQMTMLADHPTPLEDRLVIILTDTDPAANGPLRQRLRPRGFGIVLIDTDGSIVQRRPTPTTVRELSGAIDRLPSRRQETGSRRQ